jgi:hypothetical protein
MTASTIRCRILLALVLGAATVVLGPTAPLAQQSPAKNTQSAKAGKGEKLCRVKLQYTGEVRTWVCPKEVACCVWHEINYVKCGSPIIGCL